MGRSLTSHRDIVAWGFCIGGALLGVPSALGLLAIGASQIFLRSPEDKSAYLDVGKYGIAGLLQNGANAIADMFAWLGGIATWLEAVLAAGLAMALMFAIVLFFTGRGIARHAGGASAIGIVLSVIFLLLWTLVLLSTPRNAMALPAIGMTMSVYAIWALAWR